MNKDKRSLKKSLKRSPSLEALNKKHKRKISLTEDDIKEKLALARDSDIPLFSELDKGKLGVQVKNTYNYCMRLLFHRPIEELIKKNIIKKEDEDKVNKEFQKLQNEVVDTLGKLKKKKKGFSDVWKKAFKTYTKKDYDDTDPYDKSWMKNEEVKKSKEMTKAVDDYLKEAAKSLDKLLKLKKDVEEFITSFDKEVDLKAWAEEGKKGVVEALGECQELVDQVIQKTWSPHKQKIAKRYASQFITYIGSTNTGQKSITKAYVQFNPYDFDVDGQMIADELYKELANLGLKASKERFFVRKIIEEQKAIDKIELKVSQLKEENPNVKLLKELETFLTELYAFVKEVEDKITDEKTGIPGIQKDPKDLFDLAIVSGS